MNDDDAHFLMSLNDTLTCGLGACVLLFIVFVILVTIEEPTAGQGRQRELAADAASDTIGDERARARAPLTVRVRGPCRFVENVTSVGSDVETTVFVDRREGAYREKCVALLRHRRPLAGARIEVRSKTAPEGRIVLTATWGGRNLTGVDGLERRFPLGRSAGEGDYALATVQVDDEYEPVRWVR